ncbi:DUF4920 domain-containing protein [Marinicella sp. S1101]|uniref:DUF4920 domain-containing protein n=1 Tax=Marinicella marina TaxID=2996016 RepID=UPI002260DEE6|nr:DUF4920 domain-containing protein [Marinicella marina]MCX7553504.1 DUF4920 domain-containing protein [Marinicella marina]MDJ1140128.1 DUF4920 domain-containing protein [Marinicella marina]
MTKKTVILLTLISFNFMALAASMQGQPAPAFNLQDQSGTPHQLADYQGQWLVVYFYPKNDTSGCTIEAKAFRDNYATLKNMNTDVLGVSLDDAESHRAFIKKYDLPFNLLVDANKQMSRDYGVDGGMAIFSYAKRQTFIIDPKGMIAKHFEKVNPSTHADEVIAALKELQPQVTSDNRGDNESLAKVTEVIDGAKVYGQQWPTAVSEQTPLAVALETPQTFNTSNHVIAGSITRVCQKKGCWMILTDGESFARVDFNDHSFYIPMDSAGEAVVYGRLVKKELSEEQRQHYAAEGSGELPAVSYEIVADSVKISGV